jgi:hypothetical protein
MRRERVNSLFFTDGVLPAASGPILEAVKHVK